MANAITDDLRIVGYRRVPLHPVFARQVRRRTMDFADPDRLIKRADSARRQQGFHARPAFQRRSALPLILWRALVTSGVQWIIEFAELPEGLVVRGSEPVSSARLKPRPRPLLPARFLSQKK